MDQFCSIPAQPFNSNRFYYPHSSQVRAIVAVSACLTGQPVRYDGNDRYLPVIDQLTAMLQLMPICPEVGAGLTVPRPPVQLVADDTSAIRARGRDNPELDVTAQLHAYAQTSAAQFDTARAHATQAICGYLWKSRSPSCGYGSAPLFDRTGVQTGTTSGIQAAYFQRALPWLSYCEETQLVDEQTALAFVLRCRIVFDWMYAGTAEPSIKNPEALAQHRHYHFLIDRFEHDQQAALCRLAAAGNKSNYLTVLQQGCARLTAEQLLELFAG